MIISKSEIEILFSEIEKGNSLAFNRFFELYYGKLLAFARNYIKQSEKAEEITSELFVKIWLKREQLSRIQNLEVYLFVSIKNACLNEIRSNKRHYTLFSAEEPAKIYEDNFFESQNSLENVELLKLLNLAVNSLPDQRKLIFKLIKEDGLKSKEVATILGLSVRTVEGQLYKAMKYLAQSLSDYLGYHPQKNRNKKEILSLFYSTISII